MFTLKDHLSVAMKGSEGQALSFNELNKFTKLRVKRIKSKLSKVLRSRKRRKRGMRTVISSSRDNLLENFKLHLLESFKFI